MRFFAFFLHIYRIHTCVFVYDSRLKLHSAAFRGFSHYRPAHVGIIAYQNSYSLKYKYKHTHIHFFAHCVLQVEKIRIYLYVTCNNDHIQLVWSVIWCVVVVFFSPSPLTVCSDYLFNRKTQIKLWRVIKKHLGKN